MSNSSVTLRRDAPVAGGTLAAFSLGSGPDGLPPAIAVHGITSSHRSWVAVARALSGRCELIAVDLRGRGSSRTLPAPYGIAAHAADILALLDHLGLERTVLVGHSLGAYIVARVAADHPDRVSTALLVDGGLTIPGSEGVDPQAFLDAFLGPAVARLRMTFESREAYREFWQRHPAFARGDVADEDVAAYADYDLIGEPPALRSAVVEDAVRADAADLFTSADAARRLATPAKLLCAARGLQDDPNPMQPLELVRVWAAERPDLREAVPVPDVNHYTITLGRTGAAAVAETIVAAAHV